KEGLRHDRFDLWKALQGGGKIEYPDFQAPADSFLTLAHEHQALLGVSVVEQPASQFLIVGTLFRHAAARMNVERELRVKRVAVEVVCSRKGGFAVFVLPGVGVDAGRGVEQQAAEAAEILGCKVLPHDLPLPLPNLVPSAEYESAWARKGADI